jgi:iron-sulfur cluster repair protein YtfE (RIC family)
MTVTCVNRWSVVDTIEVITHEEIIMRNYGYEGKKVDQVAARVPGAGQVFRKYGIDPTNRLTMAQAAAATATPVDEVLAVMEYKARRAARRAQAAPAEVAEVATAADVQRNILHEEIEEGELVA